MFDLGIISVLLIIAYVGVIFFFFRLFTGLVRKETGIEELGFWSTAFAGFAALCMPKLMVAVANIIMAIGIWILM